VGGLPGLGLESLDLDRIRRLGRNGRIVKLMPLVIVPLVGILWTPLLNRLTLPLLPRFVWVARAFRLGARVRTLRPFVSLNELMESIYDSTFSLYVEKRWKPPPFGGWLPQSTVW